MLRLTFPFEMTHSIGRRPPTGRVAVRCLALLLAVMACGSSGCSLFSNAGQMWRYDDSFNEAAVKMRNRSMSSKSWHRHKNRYCNEQCLSDFCAGYRKGYEDVASGSSNGCTPNFPPREYWGWQHQTASGQRKVSAWFAGYPHGARAAEEDGVGNWSQIQMSSTLQSQYVSAGLLPNQGHAVYPITEPVGPNLGQPAPAAPLPNAVPNMPQPIQPIMPAPQGLGLPVH